MRRLAREAVIFLLLGPAMLFVYWMALEAYEAPGFVRYQVVPVCKNVVEHGPWEKYQTAFDMRDPTPTVPCGLEGQVASLIGSYPRLCCTGGVSYVMKDE